MLPLYKVQIKRVGEFANCALEDDMMIIFSEVAPSDAADYCFIHDHDELKGLITQGGLFKLGQQQYLITAVGDVVNQNLAQLGHITIKFDASNEAQYPGCLHVKGRRPQRVICGEEIVFLN
ncbi:MULTISPECIES: PTS glucitol/sorbitol transporter subunit IIA [Vibrio]|uniref:PTS glucitol/sorbitol transporter subunit IIA n=1 Tax=Vibrio TaxID=662 RepID=UPI0002D3108C|nr:MULTISPECIES: PTS glucitol/sorbitol transporter subunit IIA [Vibrio]KNY39808.1 PTS system glucitol/sorbitol-specific transporter subunit IIA [Vibrio harveyi]MDA0124436.1 PTS glucitol/sorbitol transporter subunit IIA [Vibrio sp. MM46]WDZ74318.1 PTS glucitol/sorbitol transporter subunit IIA [Vibrio harveyi]CAH1540635.1 sorbitol-specific PTS enzyme IIA component [Vibrio harveyi]HDM8056364.1 PTS glucitol/sorbitol transporter subunit IIA [Vibrio harveyi]